MAHSDWLVILPTFVYFVLESNVQTLRKCVSKYIDFSFEKQRSLICYETAVPADHRCVLGGFCQLCVNFDFLL